jgi:hypothetical protein
MLWGVTTACGGRAVNRSSAQKLLVSLPAGILEKEDVEILSVSQTGGRDAIIETSVRTAFKIEKVKGEWVVREIRVGNSQWERLEDLEAALDRVKAERTRSALEEIAVALDRYREKNGHLPEFRDYVSLSDQLHPGYLGSAVRLDAWLRPLGASRQDDRTVRLISAGADARFDTPDDIVVTRTYAP